MPRETHLTGKRVEPRRTIADPTRQWVTVIGVAVAVGIAFFLARAAWSFSADKA